MGTGEGREGQEEPGSVQSAAGLRAVSLGDRGHWGHFWGSHTPWPARPAITGPHASLSEPVSSCRVGCKAISLALGP